MLVFGILLLSTLTGIVIVAGALDFGILSHIVALEPTLEFPLY